MYSQSAQLPVCTPLVSDSESAPEFLQRSDGMESFKYETHNSGSLGLLDYNLSDEIESWATTDDDFEPFDYHKRDEPNSLSSSSYSSSNNEETASAAELSTQSQGGHKLPGPPPFNTPPKLKTVEDVLSNHTGTEVADLRNLAISLARDAIFGKQEMIRCSLSGRKNSNTASLDEKKINYIKTVVRSRVPSMSEERFNLVWPLCRGSISKSCQVLRTKAKRKL